MRRTVPLALLSGLFIALAATLASGSSRHAAVAAEGCNNHSLRGPYGFSVAGQAFNPPGPGYHEVAEFADAGRIVFDGSGNLNGTDTESLNGVITTALIFGGTYTVQADCTGTAAISGGISANLRFMLVEGGQEVNAFVTDPGLVATGQISKIQLNGCSNATLRGVYGFGASGSAFAPTGEIGDLAVFARIVFDGHGNSTQSTNSSFNGFQNQAPLETATYSVNPDCTGSAILHHPDGTFEHINFVIVEGGSEIKFIVATPGTVFTGTVDKQPLDED
jgi:hypothetical protein